MVGNELASEAGKAIKDAVKENASGFFGGLLSSLWNGIKSIVPYLLIIPAILVADNKLFDGKGLKFVKGLFGSKEEKHDQTTRTVTVNADTLKKAQDEAKNDKLTAAELAAQLCKKDGFSAPNKGDLGIDVQVPCGPALPKNPEAYQHR
jgi:hypothetical protein